MQRDPKCQSSLEMSPFFVLYLFLLRLLLLKNFSLASPRNDDPLLGRPMGSLFFCPVGLARPCVALRAKCRARPTTNAARWRPTWKLCSATQKQMTIRTAGRLMDLRLLPGVPVP